MLRGREIKVDDRKEMLKDLHFASREDSSEAGLHLQDCASVFKGRGCPWNSLTKMINSKVLKALA